jgi:hypothetical protein
MFVCLYIGIIKKAFINKMAKKPFYRQTPLFIQKIPIYVYLYFAIISILFIGNHINMWSIKFSSS